MKLIRQISYLTPEGKFNGKIISATLQEDTKNGRPRESVRLTIAVNTIEGDPLHDYRVRVDYWASQANDLLTDAYRLLGTAINELTDADGEIIPAKLSLFEGKEVEFTVRHTQMPGHTSPYRKVENLRPASSVIERRNDHLKRAA